MSNASQEATDNPTVVSARQLLIQTAELPDGERALLAVLGEYRRALHALVVGGGNLPDAPAMQEVLQSSLILDS